MSQKTSSTGTAKLVGPAPSQPIFARQYANFYEQIGRQLKAGLAMDVTLRNVEMGQFPDPLKQILIDARMRTDGGGSLGDTLMRHAGLIPRHEARFIQAAEAGGKLPAALAQLAEVHNKRHQRTLGLVGKLLYPIGVLVAACMIGPAGHLFTGDIPGYFAHAGLPLLMLVGTLLFSVYVSFSPAATAWRKLLYAFAQRIPPLQGALRQLAIARLGQLMGLSFDAGLPADQVFKLAAEATADRTLQRACLAVASQVGKGSHIYEAMEAQKGAFPNTMVAVVKTGEESGQLDEALLRAADLWQEDADRAVTMLIGVATAAIFGLVMLTMIITIVSIWKGVVGQVDQMIEGTP